MRDIVGLFARLAVLSAVAVACTADASLKPFRSDGCSLFPDSSAISNVDWCSCCLDHDLIYWRGGTREEREDVDRRLQECVLAKTGSAALATLMYEGVRIGGSPYFYNWYRWGYGWSYDRKYQALTGEEQDLAKTLIDDYFASAEGPICPQ